MSGDVTFNWASLPGSSEFDVLITMDKVSSNWTRVNDTQYTVRQALLFKEINIRLISLTLESGEMTFKGKVDLKKKNSFFKK